MLWEKSLVVPSEQGVILQKLIFPLTFVAFVFSILTCASCERPASSANTITIWHWMTDRHQTFLKLAEQYQRETGIKVNFELYAPSDSYIQKIVASAQARVLPDIYGIIDKKKIVASFIESGFVSDLTVEFEKNNAEWKNSFFPKALAVNVFVDGNIYNIQPGIYGVPIDVTNVQMLFNEGLLEKAGIEGPPKTFEEFIKDIRSLRRIGISGFVSGWGEMWMIECFASNYAFNIMGEEKVMATIRGEVPYTDPDWIKVFQIFSTLRDEGAFIEGIVTKPNKNAEQDFALERAAFAFNGSWCVNVYNDMNPNLRYGAMLPPAINPNLPMKIWGGAGSSFVVNNTSKNKQAAIDFLRWLTQKDQQVVLAMETKNLPANRNALASIDKILSEFAGAMDSTTHPSIWPANEDPLVNEVYTRGLQSIIIGEKSPEQVASEVQKVKERQMEKSRIRSKK
jgi:ABC-type glycerol-3-phosphate transport system substrate-binding protein